MKLGILGGMGPLAGAYFYQRLVQKTPAKKDQEHLETVFYTNPEIPDRTEAIINGGVSPVSDLVEGLRFLESVGCDESVIICNTSHYYLEEIKKKVNINILNLIENVGKNVFENGDEKVFVLGTKGTMRSGIYSKYLEKFGIEVEYPDIKEQEIVSSVIYHGVKYGNLTDRLKSNFLGLIYKIKKNYGINNIVLGCTELSFLSNMISEEFSDELKLFDPIEINTDKIIEKAFSLEKVETKISGI